ncbi:MAG: cysteine hydrolase family protein [Granulosicoccus sp.]
MVINAQPFDFHCRAETMGLVVIDMQRDFVEPGGFGESLGNDVSLLKGIIPTVATLLSSFRHAGLPVIHTRECHLPDLSDCPPAKRNRGNPSARIGDDGPMGRILVAGEPGTEIVAELAPIEGEMVIDKPGKGAFCRTELQSLLTDMGLQQLVFAGVTTEVCVQSTMGEANDRGYDCLLATDATASYFPQFKESTIQMIIAQGGIVGWATTTAQIVEALDG